MTDSEMLVILGIIRGSLPGLYLQQTPEDAELMAKHWADMFADYPKPLVEAAVHQYCFSTADRKNFPTPSDIVAQIETLVDVVHRCEKGWLVEECVENANKRFPPKVRDYINRAAAARYQRLNGKPFRSQAQLMAEKSEEQAIAEYLLRINGGKLSPEAMDFWEVDEHGYAVKV